MFANIVLYAIQVVFDFITALFLFRCYLFSIRLNISIVLPELSRFLSAMTDWAILRIRRSLPPFRRFDFASLIPAVFIQFFYLLFKFYLLNDFFLPEQLFIELIKNLVALILHGAVSMILLSAVISWVQPNTQIHHAFNQLTAPILMPIRRIIPLIGGLDLSPLVALLILQIIQKLLFY